MALEMLDVHHFSVTADDHLIMTSTTGLGICADQGQYKP